MGQVQKEDLILADLRMIKWLLFVMNLMLVAKFCLDVWVTARTP